MIKSTLKIARYCPLVIQGFSNFIGLFQVIMANPKLLVHANGMFFFKILRPSMPVGRREVQRVEWLSKDAGAGERGGRYGHDKGVLSIVWILMILR